jgi:hypothetical protein
MEQAIHLGSRVYLKLAIAGEPGIVCGFGSNGKVHVEWLDMLEVGVTAHSPDSLIVDETFSVRQLDLFEFAQVAA